MAKKVKGKTTAKGIHGNPYFKLGKAKAKHDARNLKLATILRAPVALPKEYDFDTQHRTVPTPMFANDTYGDCVIAGRAHQTMRFELIEQSKVLTIKDNDVTREYFKESGGADSGLVVLDSLKEWRSKGWSVSGRKYKIKAFAQINQQDPDEVKRAVFLDIGAGMGLSLPKTAQAQIDAGKPWDAVNGSGSAPNSWGGHYVYLSGYTATGPVCVTWGRKQQMTWAFVNKYCDEAYAIIDAVNTAKKKRGLDQKKLNAFLESIKK